MQQPIPSESRGGFKDLPPIEQNLTRPRSLAEHLRWQLQVSDFPAVVTMDAGGNDLHDELQRSSAERLSALIGAKP